MTTTIKQIKQNTTFSLFNSLLLPDYQASYLTPEHWQALKAISGSSQGRGTTYFISYNQQQWVLKHYYRGGLMGKLNKDWYLFTNLPETRAFKEFNLLETMRLLKLPVPKPVACRVIKKGLLYQADLLTTRIECAEDLVEKLARNEISSSNWHNIGQIIKQFHLHGIYHHDLNSHNILLSQTNEISIIDFDRGEQRADNKSKWQEANMARLLRSFRKEKARLPQFFWQEKNWQQLMEGYLNN